MVFEGLFNEGEAEEAEEIEGLDDGSVTNHDEMMIFWI